MTAVLTILRMRGLPLCISIGMLGFYEGVPVLRDIPYADRIPVVRELILGRLQSESFKAASPAREFSKLKVRSRKKGCHGRTAREIPDYEAKLKAAGGSRRMMMLTCASYSTLDDRLSQAARMQGRG